MPTRNDKVFNRVICDKVGMTIEDNICDRIRMGLVLGSAANCIDYN